MKAFIAVAVLVATVAGLGLQAPVPLYQFNEAKWLALNPQEETQHAGYIQIPGTKDANLFYWVFEAREDPENAPLLLWLNGGPGCSSLLGLFTELGPYTIDPESLELVTNPYSWNTKANLLFVDQPVGTGFSYTTAPTDMVRSGEKLGEHMALFLEEFLDQFPQYKTDAGFWISGESYAGHYIPAIAKAVNDHAKVDLRGIALGNAWVYPEVQYGAYGPFAYDNELIGGTAAKVAEKAYGVCKKLIEKKLYPIALTECQLIVTGLMQAIGDINPYDYRIPCEKPPLCYDMAYVDEYLDLPEVREALGVGDHKWTECDMLVHSLMMGDWIHSYDQHIPDIIARGQEVLVYSGDVDFIVNWYGGRDFVAAMEWEHQDDYNNAAEYDWLVEGDAAGTGKTYKNLTFLRVFQAGHMVPMDQPVNSLDMIHRFLFGGGYQE